MNDTDTGLLPAVERNPDRPPRAAVIWMHGLGADGYDFASVPPQLGLPPELGIRYVFPHAPRRPVTVNMGMVMPAWYDITSLTARGQDEAGVRASAAAIERLIAREVENGIAPQRIVLAGFSQGAGMALFTGLRHAQRLAGIMVLSGYLLLPETLAAEAGEANRQTPIFQAHGQHDPMVPAALGHTCRDQLRQAGYEVAWHEYPMAHQVCLEELQDIGSWLGKVLGDDEV